jgi:hypothetical protein
VCSRRRDRDRHQNRISSRQELLIQPEVSQGVQPASRGRLVRRGYRERRQEKKACAFCCSLTCAPRLILERSSWLGQMEMSA